MSDRHPKWQRVEPGTVIPAGQPYRIEHGDGTAYEGIVAAELGLVVCDLPETPMFRDSSWKPPLVLPTEPTWGIALRKGSDAKWFGQFRREGGTFRSLSAGSSGYMYVSNVADFIPLTDEQVARIEAAR